MKQVTTCRQSDKQVFCVCCVLCVVCIVWCVMCVVCCSVFCVVSRDVTNEFEEPMKQVTNCRQSDKQVFCVCCVACGA